MIAAFRRSARDIRLGEIGLLSNLRFDQAHIGGPQLQAFVALGALHQSPAINSSSKALLPEFSILRVQEQRHHHHRGPALRCLGNLIAQGDELLNRLR